MAIEDPVTVPTPIADIFMNFALIDKGVVEYAAFAFKKYVNG